jgi:uncharacterized protein (TIGR02996 family)
MTFTSDRKARWSMTHDDAFLQAIGESPDDDTPRVIYADWLDDHGHYERAEFIRVQCQLARMPAGDGQRHPLEELERRLLERHQGEWLGSLRPSLSAWRFRRGFLDAVTVPAATYMRHATFPRPASVRRIEVDLDGFEMPAEALELGLVSVAYQNVLLLLGFRDKTFVIAVQDPLDMDLLSKMEFIMNCIVEQVPAPGRQVAEAIRRQYGDPVFGSEEPDLAGCFVSPSPFPPGELDLGAWDNGSPAARLLDRIIATAIGLNAREVRIEPGPDRIQVRYICNGGTIEGGGTPIQLLWPVLTRIQIMSGIRLGDVGEEQAGATRLTVRGRRIDVGVVVHRRENGPAAVLTFHRGIQATAQSRP